MLTAAWKSGADTVIDEDLVNMWRYPTALQCRYTVAQMVLGELNCQSQVP